MHSSARHFITMIRHAGLFSMGCFVSENWEALTAAAAVLVPTIVQITPIKINPWSWLARSIGRALNREIMVKVDTIQQSLDKHITADAERGAKDCRLRVLRFNDEIIQGQRHTREHFHEILDDITAYERYCAEHPLFENSKAELAIENVKRIYKKCEENNSFL